MNRNSFRLFEEGILRAQFIDADAEFFVASGVEVNLYAPGDIPGTDLPTVSGLVPTHLSDGIYQLNYTHFGVGGTWTDEWRGHIMGTLTSAQFNHLVLDGTSSTARLYPSLGPCENNLIEVTLASGIQSLDGNLLGEEYSFFFTTTYTPYYSDPKKVRLEAGSLLAGVTDYAISVSVLESSIEAEALTFATQITNNKLYQHARREYVTCRAALTLAQNVMANGGLLKSKRLADFSVEYDVTGLKELIDNLFSTCKRWLDQLQTGGGARAIQDPQRVIKGELDPDRPLVGRLWSPVRNPQHPYGNSKALRSGTRRPRTYWTDPKNKWKGDW